MSDVVAQNRHILSMMGISLWAKKSHATTHVHHVCDRMSNPRLARILDMVIPQAMPEPLVLVDKDEICHKLQHLNQPSSQLPQSLDLTNVPKQPSDDAKPTPVSPPPALADIRYQLQGVRYRDWLVVVDMTHLDTNAQSLWFSLSQALTNHAQTHGLAWRVHEVAYPFVEDDYAEHQNFTPAQDVFLGFMIGLALPNALSAFRVAFLTPLPDGIDYLVSHDLPSIDDMIKNANHKRALWQKVVGD